MRKREKTLVKNVPIIPFWKTRGWVEVAIKIKTFVWLLLHGWLLIRDMLARPSLISDKVNICPLCKETGEDINHLFI